MKGAAGENTGENVARERSTSQPSYLGLEILRLQRFLNPVLITEYKKNYFWGGAPEGKARQKSYILNSM